MTPATLAALAWLVLADPGLGRAPEVSAPKVHEVTLSVSQWSYQGFLRSSESFLGLDVTYRRAISGLPLRVGGGLRSAGLHERVAVPLEAYGLAEWVSPFGIWEPTVGVELGLSGFTRLNLADRGGLPPSVHAIEEARISPVYFGFNASALRFRLGSWTVSALELQLGTTAFPLGATARTQLGLLRVGAML